MRSQCCGTRAREVESWSLGYPLITAVCDVTDREQVQKTIESVANQLGTVDILVNNAGTLAVGPMDTMTLEDYRESDLMLRIESRFRKPSNQSQTNSAR